MSTAAYYREEAKRYRDLAAASPGSEAAKQWLRFAADYDQIASLLEESRNTQPPGQSGAAQQQPQTKQEPEDKE
jgi:hypothetical protein